MTRALMMKDGTPLKVLQYLSTADGSTSKGLKLALTDIDNDSMDRTLTTLKRKQFVLQKEKGAGYFIAAKGIAILRSFGAMAAAPNRFAPVMPLASKKPGAPKKGKVTNGIIKFSRPASMSTTMFSELVSEHSTAERRCEAIENLFQSWPR